MFTLFLKQSCLLRTCRKFVPHSCVCLWLLGRVLQLDTVRPPLSSPFPSLRLHVFPTPLKHSKSSGPHPLPSIPPKRQLCTSPSHLPHPHSSSLFNCETLFSTQPSCSEASMITSLPSPRSLRLRTYCPHGSSPFANPTQKRACCVDKSRRRFDGKRN